MGIKKRNEDAELAELAARLGDRLAARGQSLATAESCTGGWIAKALTDIAGSSAWFLGGWVTYSDALKRAQLGVRAETLALDGAVSEAVVAEMAAGARRKSGADWAIAVSGVAGPGGGSPTKPVGLVWLGFAGPARAWTSQERFRGDREAVRRATVARALAALADALA